MTTIAPIHLDDELGKRGPILVARFQQSNHAAARAPVSHDYAALKYYVGGRSRVSQRANWNLGAGDVQIVPAGEPHQLIDGHEEDFWGLGFSVPCFAADVSAALIPFERVREGASPVVRIPPERRLFLETLFAEMSAISTSSADALVQQSFLTLILNEVTRAAAWSHDAPASSSVVAASLRFIEHHCLEPLTLLDVAAAVGRNPAYVTTALTRATGRSAVAWIIAGRMAEARRRLLHSDERVESVAERVGYADATHFIRLFRRVHGQTPAAWRASQRSS